MKCLMIDRMLFARYFIFLHLKEKLSVSKYMFEAKCLI